MPECIIPGHLQKSVTDHKFLLKIAKVIFSYYKCSDFHSNTSAETEIKSVADKKYKGVSHDTPIHIIQKHYEFYSANKI